MKFIAPLLVLLTAVAFAADVPTPKTATKDAKILNVRLRTPGSGTSLTALAPAWLEVTNTSRNSVVCDLFGLDDNIIMRVQDARRPFKESYYSMGYVPSRSFVPTPLKPGETVTMELHLAKLMPRLSTGRKKLRFQLVSLVVSVTSNGEVLDHANERHEGVFNVQVAH
jgi:hypothetical protein